MSTTLSMSSRQCEPVDRLGVPDPVGVARPSCRGPAAAAAGCRGRPSPRRRARPAAVVDDRRLVAARPRPQRHPAGVGDRLALAVAAPAPVVERAGDLVALDPALGEVAAHVAAVAVEHVELALVVGPDHELAAEGLDPVRLAVPERLGQAEAVPAASEALRGVPWSRLGHSLGVSLMWPLSASLKTRTRSCLWRHARRPLTRASRPARGAPRLLRPRW